MEDLKRALSLRHFIAIGINICIGGSIYLIGADVYRLVGEWSLLIAASIGTFALIMSLVIAEVSSRFDSTGGPYVYARTAFGRFWGFEVGWMMWFTRVTVQASLTNGIVTSVAYFTGGSVSNAARMIGIVVITLGITFIHLRRVEQGARTILAFAIFKLLPLVSVLVAAAWLGEIQPVDFGRPPGTADAVTVALLLIFSFSGYEIIPVTAGEGRNPKRDAPLATVVSVVVMVCVWLLLHLALINTLPNLANEPRPVATAAAVLMGSGMEAFVNVAAIVSALGTCIGSQLTASRNLYAVANDGLAPRWFAAVHPVQRVPQNAILFSTAVILVLALSGSFVFLAAASAIPRIFIFFSIAAALIRFRHLSPEKRGVASAGFTLPLGSLLAGIAMLACVSILTGVSAAQLSFGVGGFLIGVALYFGNAWRRKKIESAVRG